MTDVVSAGISAAVEELIISPPASRTLSTSAAADADAVVGCVVLGLISFFLGNT